MKTRLLLLFALMYSAMGFSQMQFSNLTSSAITGTTATLNVNLSFVCSGSNYRMQYHTSDTFLAGTVDIGYQTNNINGIKNHPITGLLPDTQYFFRFYASPNQGCGNTTQITSATASFTTLGAPAIAEYNFNNALTDVNGTNPFTSNAANSFVTGRDGITLNGAININNQGTTAIIPNLSYGAAPRTVSMWVKMNFFQPSFNFLYHYGTSGTGNGTYINQSNVIHFPLTPTNHSVAAANAINTWYHYVISYDGTSSKIYRNGVLLNSAPRTLNTGANTVANLFRLGLSENGTSGLFDGAIDDLKIYNYALSQTSVTNLFTSVSAVPGPSIASVSATGVNTTSATISYSLNANNTQTTSVVKYGLSSGNLTSTAAGFAASGNTVTPGNAPITGLLAGTQYFYRIEATNAAGTSTSTEGNFTTSSGPIISAITANTAPTSTNINYSLNANNAITTSVIAYGINSSNLSSSTNGFAATGNTVTAGTVSISGLSPVTQYFYRIDATNIVGTSQSPILSFTTPEEQIIAEYNFNNTYNNLNGNSPFTTNAGVSFVNDRHGNSNAAINLTAAGIQASIPTLPFNTSSRTISFWAKLNSMQTFFNHTFSYGGILTGLGFEGSLNATSVNFSGYGDDFSISSVSTVSIWYHFVYTYDGTNVKIYKNGVLLGAEPKNLNTAVYDIFSLGRSLNYSSTFNGAIDDLKIYNYAVTDAQVFNLYNNNTLSSADFNQNNLQVSLYPNPATDILNIEMTNEIKSIEIYNIQGQKVMSSNQKQINISDLAAGLYMVRIQDVDNAIATKKIIIE
jgi:hypothetical protein